MSRYGIALVLSISGPLVLSFFPPLMFWKKARAVFCSMLLVTLVFGTWDIIATMRGHWYFDPAGISGIYFLDLPLEEVLFFPVITFCCIFTWETVKFLKGKLK